MTKPLEYVTCVNRELCTQNKLKVWWGLSIRKHRDKMFYYSFDKLETFGFCGTPLTETSQTTTPPK